MSGGGASGGGASASRAAHADSGVVTLGETMLLLAGGPLVDASTMTIGTGGAESNTAIALAHLGVPTTWVGRVGADPAGDRVVADIRAQGVTAVVVRDPERSTAFMTKERLADGRTRVTYHRRGSAGSALAPTDIPPGLVEGAALLHGTGITLALGGTARSALLDAVDRAEQAGVPVAFDVNHRPKLLDDTAARARYREVVARSAIVFAGDDEARLVLGRTADDEELALRLADLAGGRAVVKLGSRGAVAAIDGRVTRRAPTPVHVVDPVGAGDAFVAAYLAAMLAGATPDDALDRAADAGALACTVPGDWHSLPVGAQPGGAEPAGAQPGGAQPAGDPVDPVVDDHVDR